MKKISVGLSSTTNPTFVNQLCWKHTMMKSYVTLDITHTCSYERIDFPRIHNYDQSEVLSTCMSDPILYTHGSISKYSDILHTVTESEVYEKSKR